MGLPARAREEDASGDSADAERDQHGCDRATADPGTDIVLSAGRGLDAGVERVLGAMPGVLGDGRHGACRETDGVVLEFVEVLADAGDVLLDGIETETVGPAGETLGLLP